MSVGADSIGVEEASRRVFLGGCDLVLAGIIPKYISLLSEDPRQQPAASVLEVHDGVLRAVEEGILAGGVAVDINQEKQFTIVF